MKTHLSLFTILALAAGCGAPDPTQETREALAFGSGTIPWGGLPSGAGPWIKPFDGAIELDYQHQQDPRRLIPAGIPQTLTQSFQSAWTDARAKVCDQLRQKINPTKWYSCNLPVSGTLGARMLGPNQVELKYDVTGASAEFEVGQQVSILGAELGSWADPDIWLHWDLAIDNVITLDPAIDANAPVSWTSGTRPVPYHEKITLSFANAHLTSGSAPRDKLAAGEAQLNAVQQDVTDPAKTAAVNDQLYSAAHGAATLFLGPDDRPYFDLEASIDVPNEKLDIVLRRDGNRPASAPTGCHYQVVCGDHVYASCDPSPGPLSLGRVDSQGQLLGVVGGGMDDGYPTGDDVQVYSVCTHNDGGSACTTPTPVTMPHQTCVRGPGGGTPDCIRLHTRCPQTGF